MQTLKKILRITGISITIVVAVFLYLVYLGQNRFSVMLHQGLTSLPPNLHNVTIKYRRNIFSILGLIEGGATSTCTVSKKDLAAWLQHTDFVFISKEKDPFHYLYYFDYNASTPKPILNNEEEYCIQFQLSNPKAITVTPLDKDNVTLSCNSDWN